MSFISVIFIIITLLGFIGVFIEAVTYNGFLTNIIKFNPVVLVFISLFISLVNLLNKNSISLPKRLMQANNYFLLPSTLIFSVGLTTLELLNYPNFVYSQLHISYELSYYFFLLSLSVTIFSLNKASLKMNADKYIFVLSLILIISALIIRTWPNGIFYNLIREDSLLEDLQFIFYLFTGISFLLISIKNFKRNKLFFVYFLLFGVFMIFIAGEEISWGQRIFGISSPEIAMELNTQKETTIHNFKGLNELQPIMYIIFSAVLSFGWIILKAFPNKYSILLPNMFYILYFLPILIFYIHINVLGGSNWHWQEACEVFLSIGLLIYSQRTLKTL